MGPLVMFMTIKSDPWARSAAGPPDNPPCLVPRVFGGAWGLSVDNGL